MFIANPIAGATMPYQFLPAPWGEIGQNTVPGVANYLVRSLAYFPDANVAAQWIILGAWTAAGVILTLIGHFRNRAVAPSLAEHEPDGPGTTDGVRESAEAAETDEVIPTDMPTRRARRKAHYPKHHRETAV